MYQRFVSVPIQFRKNYQLAKLSDVNLLTLLYWQVELGIANQRRFYRFPLSLGFTDIPEHSRFCQICVRANKLLQWIRNGLIKTAMPKPTYTITPASIHDINMVKTLVDQYPFPNILADVGYLSRKLKSELAKLGINFWTPKRHNMLHGKANNYLLMRNRRYIETVFSQWNDIFNLEKNRAHSLSGFQTIIEQCLLVYTLKKIN